MKIQKPKRNVSSGYFTIQLIVFGLPFLGLYNVTGNIWWGLAIFVLYLVNEVPVWHGMKYGVPRDAVPPRIMTPPKGSTVPLREIVLRLNMMFAVRALACGCAMVIFGALVAFNTGNDFWGAVIATIGVFGTWQALRGVRYFAHVS